MDDRGRTKENENAISVIFLGDNTGTYNNNNITLSNNEIWSGNSTSHWNTGIVVGAENVNLDGNTIHLGVSGRTDTTKQRNEFIGIRTWTYKANTDNLKIVNNTILKNESTTTTNPQVGILFDAVKDNSSAIIQNNTFNLGSAGTTGAVPETMTENTSTSEAFKPSLNLTFTDNTITSAGHWLYVARDNAITDEKYNYDLIPKGGIYNNNFSQVANSFFLNASNVTYNRTSPDLKWNTTVAAISDHKSIVTGQMHVAGNWWGTWSSDRKATAGYLTFADAEAAKAAGLLVADLAPLVTVGTPAGTLKIEGDPSIENGTTPGNSLTAKLSEGTVAGTDMQWTVTDANIITLTSPKGSSVTYKPLRVGTTTVKVNTTVGESEVETSILIIVYQVAKPNIDTEVTKEDDGTTENQTVLERVIHHHDIR